MADDNMALLETLRRATADGDVDVLREGVRVLAQAIMEAEVTELTGVPHGERDPERRLTNRNGYRDRRWDTRVGSIDRRAGRAAAEQRFGMMRMATDHERLYERLVGHGSSTPGSHRLMIATG